MLAAMDASGVGRVMRAIRKHLGQTQGDVAIRAGLSQSVYSRAGCGELTGMTLGSEVKSRFTDLQSMFISLSRKLRVVPNAAREELGWDAVTLARVVVAYGTAESRAIIGRHRSIFDVALPARAVDVRRWLAEPTGTIAGVWLVSGDVLPIPGIHRSRDPVKRRR